MSKKKNPRCIAESSEAKEFKFMMVNMTQYMDASTKLVDMLNERATGRGTCSTKSKKRDKATKDVLDDIPKLATEIGTNYEPSNMKDDETVYSQKPDMSGNVPEVLKVVKENMPESKEEELPKLEDRSTTKKEELPKVEDRSTDQHLDQVAIVHDKPENEDGVLPQVAGKFKVRIENTSEPGRSENVQEALEVVKESSPDVPDNKGREPDKPKDKTDAAPEGLIEIFHDKPEAGEESSQIEGKLKGRTENTSELCLDIVNGIKRKLPKSIEQPKGRPEVSRATDEVPNEKPYNATVVEKDQEDAPGVKGKVHSYPKLMPDIGTDTKEKTLVRKKKRCVCKKCEKPVKKQVVDKTTGDDKAIVDETAGEKTSTVEDVVDETKGLA